MKRKKGFLPLRALGKRVAVRFHDHSIYSTDQVQCEIMGLVEKLNEKEVIIRWWSTFDKDDAIPDTGDSNNEVARVLQGTIIKWALCEPRNWNEVE
jgi:hypothetical protein